MNHPIPVKSTKTSLPFTFRPIQKADIDQVAKLIRQVMTEYDCVGAGYSINDPEIDDMYEAYQEERAAFFVIEQKGEVLGCGGIGPLSKAEDTCELKKMYFYEELRGYGWGKRLLVHCLETARQMAYKRCYLETVERMKEAIVLYEKMGFEKSCSQIGDTGHSSCETYYIKNL